MPDKNVIRKKLIEIVNQLKNLKSLTRLSYKELFGDQKNQLYSERVMERLIQAAIDINMHIVSDLTGKTPIKYFDSFIAMGEIEVISMTLAKKLAPSTTTRNLLAHEYENINGRKFQKSMKDALRDYTKYAKYLEKWT